MRNSDKQGLPPGVHRKKAKGNVYYYFDTGARAGKKVVLKPLPKLGSAEFGPAYAQALSAKSRRSTSTVPILTLKDLADRYERSNEFRKLADSTQRTYLRYLGDIVANLGMGPAQDVTRADIVLLLDTYSERPGAANMVRAVVRALYTWGRRRGLATAKPAEDILDNESTDYAPWPQELIDAALGSDDEIVRISVALLYFTAQRIGDVCRMRWSDIHDGVIDVEQEKTGLELEIPLHSRLPQLIGQPKGITVLVKDGNRFSPAAIRGRIQRWAKERGYDIVPHGLRKNAVNAILEAGASAAETAAISGQSLQMVEHYAKKRNRGRLAQAAILKWNGGRT